MSFKISDEQRDVIVIENLKDDYLFLRKQMIQYTEKEVINDVDEDNYLTDAMNASYVYGVLKYYMNREDFYKFVAIVTLELDKKP